MRNNKLTIDIDVNNKNLVKKLNAISKHAAALAEELEKIDEDKCPRCNETLKVDTLYADGKELQKNFICEDCGWIRQKLV
jgi:MinD superfamily P-loop ATPase